jgi:hypothetical protein
MARILYTKAGSDPTVITWPPGQAVGHSWQLTSGTPATITDLIASPVDRTILYPDGRIFPSTTPNGSTFVLQYP